MSLTDLERLEKAKAKAEKFNQTKEQSRPGIVRSENKNVAIKDNAIIKITNLHNSIGFNLSMALNSAMEIGELLKNKKAELGHGNFLPWLKELPFSERTARNYIAIHDKKDQIQSANITDLTEAYRLISASESNQEKLENSDEKKDRANEIYKIFQSGEKIDKEQKKILRVYINKLIESSEKRKEKIDLKISELKSELSRVQIGN